MEREVKANSHAIKRTSPFGEKFVGKCVLCGMVDLTIDDINDDCQNPMGVLQSDALVGAIISGPSWDEDEFAKHLDEV